MFWLHKNIYITKFKNKLFAYNFLFTLNIVLKTLLKHVFMINNNIGDYTMSRPKPTILLEAVHKDTYKADPGIGG